MPQIVSDSMRLFLLIKTDKQSMCLCHFLLPPDVCGVTDLCKSNEIIFGYLCIGTR